MLKRIPIFTLATIGLYGAVTEPAYSSYSSPRITVEQRKAPYEWTTEIPRVPIQIDDYTKLYEPYVDVCEDISNRSLDGFAELGKRGFTHALKGLAYQWQLDLLHHFWGEFKKDAQEKKLTITTFQHHIHRLIFLCNPTLPKNNGIDAFLLPAVLTEENKWQFLENYSAAYASSKGWLAPSSYPKCYKAIIFSKKGGISIPTLLKGTYAFEKAPLNLVTFAIFPGEKGHDGILRLPSTFFGMTISTALFFR